MDKYGLWLRCGQSPQDVMHAVSRKLADIFVEDGILDAMPLIDDDDEPEGGMPAIDAQIGQLSTAIDLVHHALVQRQISAVRAAAAGHDCADADYNSMAVRLLFSLELQVSLLRIELSFISFHAVMH
jgi:hypothetical protein